MYAGCSFEDFVVKYNIENAPMNDTSKPSENKEEIPMDRRRFCLRAGHAAVGLVGVGTAGVLYKFLSPNVILEIPPRFQLGMPDAFRPDTFVFDEAHKLFVIRNENGLFYAVSSVCTHLGCLVNRNITSASAQAQPGAVFICPCHGSTYDRVGNVLDGPAPRPLDRFRVVIENGKVVVDTREIVDENDMFLKV